MKKRRVFWAALVIFACTTSWSSFTAAAPIELSLSLMIGPKHNRWTYVLEPWVKMVEEKTQGKVKIKPFFSNTLAPAQEMFDSTVTGIADITENITYITPGRFPLTEMAMFPNLGGKSSLGLSRSLQHLYRTFPELKAEYKGVRVLWLHSSSPMRLLSAKKPIKDLEELRKMKVWVSGAAPVRVARAIGFSPVSMAPGDVYTALERGVVDAAMASNEIAVSRKFTEVCKYFNEIDTCSVPFYVIMNQKKWDSLPEDVKKVFEELTGDFAAEFTGRMRDKEEVEAGKQARQKGVEFFTPAAAELEKIRNLVEPVKEAYASELDAKGLPGKKVLQELMKSRE